MMHCKRHPSKESLTTLEDVFTNFCCDMQCLPVNTILKAFSLAWYSTTPKRRTKTEFALMHIPPQKKIQRPVGGGEQETWNLCDRRRQPSFYQSANKVPERSYFLHQSVILFLGRHLIPPQGGYCSRRYASHWIAFLFMTYFYRTSRGHGLLPHWSATVPFSQYGSCLGFKLGFKLALRLC